MPNAYLLNEFLLAIIELVEITIDLLQADIFFEVPSQIVYRSFLAHRRAYPGHYRQGVGYKVIE